MKTLVTIMLLSILISFVGLILVGLWAVKRLMKGDRWYE